MEPLPPPPAGPAVRPSFGRRLVWIPIGLVCVGLGGVGVVVPGLPSTVFFVAATACFAKSSPRLEAWVLGLPGVGSLVRDYRAGLGMPKQAKITAITMLTIAVGLSAWSVDPVWVKVCIVGAGLIGVVVILRVPTKSPAPTSTP